MRVIVSVIFILSDISYDRLQKVRVWGYLSTLFWCNKVIKLKKWQTYIWVYDNFKMILRYFSNASTVFDRNQRQEFQSENILESQHKTLYMNGAGAYESNQ